MFALAVVQAHVDPPVPPVGGVHVKGMSSGKGRYATGSSVHSYPQALQVVLLCPEGRGVGMARVAAFRWLLELSW